MSEELSVNVTQALCQSGKDVKELSNSSSISRGGRIIEERRGPFSLRKDRNEQDLHRRAYTISMLIFEKAAQTSVPGRMPELLKGTSFNLAHPFAAELQLFTDFLQGANFPIAEPKPCSENELFPGR